MAIKFFNVRNKEVRVAETEPQISALWGSSDHSPNITQGQDFGWRLAPEVVVEMNRIKNDIRMIERIAATFNRPVDDIGETDILQWISSKTSEANAPVAKQEDYTEEYQKEIARIQRQEDAKATTLETATTTTTTTESLADMRERAELAERIAKANTTTTTTTTESPITTAVTTKK